MCSLCFEKVLSILAYFQQVITLWFLCVYRVKTIYCSYLFTSVTYFLVSSAGGGRISRDLSQGKFTLRWHCFGFLCHLLSFPPVLTVYIWWSNNVKFRWVFFDYYYFVFLWFERYKQWGMEKHFPLFDKDSRSIQCNFFAWLRAWFVLLFYWHLLLLLLKSFENTYSL